MGIFGGEMQINIVLVEPEIPQNTGNIARTCAATGARLHLVKPLGFSVEDKYLKRAGLDYWGDVELYYYENFNELKEKFSGNSFYFSTTRAKKSYSEVVYKSGDFIVFGKETAGLPVDLLENNWEQCIRIPVRENIRSLNLSNAAAIITYEAYRQNEFKGLTDIGRGI
jgi:tRNA (cytidine/uridine-2'-O-)-methyltransferase